MVSVGESVVEIVLDCGEVSIEKVSFLINEIEFELMLGDINSLFMLVVLINDNMLVCFSDVLKVV